MARPRKTTHTLATRVVSFRLTDAEYSELEVLAGRAGLRVNELARRFTRRGPRRVIIQTTRRYDPALIAQIHRIGLNLNQLVHNAHIFGRVSPKVSEVCDEIRRVVFSAIESETPT